MKKSVDYYKQAIDLDPNYALAYAGMADAYYSLSGNFLPPEEAMPRVRAAVAKALQLDETLAEAHSTLAMYKMSYDWGDWGETERAFKRAIELNPGYAQAHNSYGIFLVLMGRFDEALAETRRAQELDPLSPFFRVGAVWPLYFGRRYDQAIQELRKIVAWNPEFVNGHFNLGQAYTQKEMYEEAIAALNKAKSIDNRPMISAFLGYAYARAGKHNEARQALAELQAPASGERISNYSLAIVYAGLGEKDQALVSLQKTYDARDDYALMLKVEPVFDDLRSDPRFRDLLRRMNLAP